MTTPRLTPFRPTAAGAAPLLVDDFSDWASRYTITGDPVLSDAWSAVQPQIETEQLFFWGTEETEQIPFNRSTRATTVYGAADGLPPNTLVRLTIDVTWLLGSFIDLSVSFIGVYVNGTGFRPVQLPSGSFSAPTIPMSLWGITDAAGDLEVAFAVEGVHPSFNLNIVFGNLRITTPAAELADIYYDAGVGYIAGNPFSITRGGIRFDPQEVIEDYDFPGKCAPVQGCDEIISMRPVLRTIFMLTGEYQFEVYRPDGTWADGELEGMRRYLMAAMRRALSAGYLENFVAIWPRSRGDYVGVLFPVAICRKYGMSSADKDEGGIEVEIEARVPSGQPVNTVPYEIFTLPATATAVP